MVISKSKIIFMALLGFLVIAQIGEIVATYLGSRDEPVEETGMFMMSEMDLQETSKSGYYEGYRDALNRMVEIHPEIANTVDSLSQINEQR